MCTAPHDATENPLLTSDIIIRARLAWLNDRIANLPSTAPLGELRAYAAVTRNLMMEELAKNENFILALTQPSA